MPPPRIDRSIGVTNDHLAAATLWLEGYAIPPELEPAATELEEAGLARDGRLAPRLGELLEVMVRPALRVHLEVLTPTSLHADLVWMAPHLAVTGDLDGPRMTLTAVDPIFLLPELARRVGLRRGPAAPLPAAIEVPTDLLDDVESALGEGDGDVGAIFTAAGVDDPELREALTNLVRHRRATWRCNATWLDGDVTASRSLIVLAAGPAGLVEIRDGRDDATIHLHPRPSTEVFAALRGVLPTTDPEVAA